MKILVVASNMVHIKNFHLPYVEEFKRQGHNTLVMADGEGADFEIPFKKRSLSIKNACLSLKIRKIIKKEQFDVIYLNTTLAAFWVRMALKGIKNRPIVVNTVHGYLFGKGFSKLHNKIYLFCEKVLKKQTDYIAVMNDEDEKIAKDNSLCLKKIYKIDGMGIDFSKREIPVAKYNIPPKNLLYVGELNKRKNQIFIVKALLKLNDVNLTLVGDGSEREKIEKYVKANGLENRVTITGYTKNVGEYLKNADLYVSASTVEGLPFNVLEAMRAKLPIVASNVKGQCDLLPSDSLYELYDEDRLISLIKNPPIHNLDASKYEINSAMAKNMSIYLECAGAKTVVEAK